MKTHLPSFALLVGGGLLFAGLTGPSRGEAGADDAPPAALVTEAAAQAATIADNQAKIDEKLAAIAEDVRQARIFAARGR